MATLSWVAVALCAVQGGYMAFDGVRALTVGRYVTPRTGPHAGQLGPWARIVRAVGVPPESTGMKLVFVAFGAAWLAAAVALALGADGARWPVVALAVATLWYLVPGTLISVAVLVLLLVS